MGMITELKPEKVFEFFELISSVPHGSGNTGAISALLCDFAEKRALEHRTDDIGNVIIYKPASAGYEEHESVILQGHMDMVAVRTADCGKDLENEGLTLCTDGSVLWAEGTSLGADDGIALAMTMAVLDSDSIPHPPIEAVFTVNEETDMGGAQALDSTFLRSKRMINLDTEDEGTIMAGSAGGIKLCARFRVKRNKDYVHAARIAIYGISGGHSGTEIHRGGANSNVLLGRLLARLGDVRIISASGGEKDNAIARKTVCEIAISNFDAVKREVAGFEAEVKAEYAGTDPGLTVTIVDEGIKNTGSADIKSSLRMIKMLGSVPNGVQSMSEDIGGLVQTSLNFGVLRIKDNAAEMSWSLRSSDAKELGELKEIICALVSANGGTVVQSGFYPAWEYRKESPLRECAVKAYEDLYGAKPAVRVIHAGLECGIFSEKLPGLDCISFGPTMTGIHTTEEKLDISSTERTFELLKAILKSI